MILQDFRIAFRTLAKRVGFTAVVVLTFALGIGANTTIFSVVDGVLLRPLDYEDPDELVLIWETVERTNTAGASVPTFVDWRDDARSFASMGAWMLRSANLTGGGSGIGGGDGGAAQRVNTSWVTAGVLGAVRGEALLGRTFTPDEFEAGNDGVALLHHSLWESRFGADPAIVGADVEIDGELRTVVGVMPPDFSFPAGTLIWLPFAADASRFGRHNHFLRVVARMSPGVSVEQAQADMTTVSAGVADANPEMEGWGSRVVPLQEQVVQNARPMLLLLMGSVGLVLLIACANVAGLLFVRSASREREVAIRSALGAGRGRLIRQSLTESLLLAGLGGAVGVLASGWGIDLLRTLAAGSVPLLDRVELDARILSFTGILTVLTGLVAGAVPAIRGSGPRGADALRGGERTQGLEGRSRSRGFLVGAEVALSLTLLICAGLLVESFVRLNRVELGFESERLLTMRIGLGEAEYPDGAQVAAFYQRAVDELEAIPGVESAVAVSDLPVDGARGGLFIAHPGEPIVPEGGQPLVANYHVVSPRYHEVMGIPLVRGRYLGPDDRAGTPLSVVVSETMARRYWPDEDPVGQRFQVEFEGELATVVGIVGDVHQNGLRGEINPAMYFTHEQIANHSALAEATRPLWQETAFALRTAADPAIVVAAARERIAGLDFRLPVFAVHTMDEIRSRRVSDDRFTTTLFTVFAGLSVLLAALGIYGVVSFTVAGRRPEIGLRMALGASPGEVVRAFVGRGMIPVAVGIGVGVVAALVLTRYLSSLLFGVSAVHLPIYLAVAALLGTCAFVACFLPARRAARVDPMAALGLK